MTDKQINAAISEMCGWKGNLICRDMEGNLWPSEPPNYCSDLNAMHEAEKVLSGYQQIHTYVWHLGNRQERVIYDKLMDVHISARDRAEAFLKTLSKWEEVQG